jgi:hypothetical protein
LSDLSGSLSSFFSSPLGSLAEFGTLAGLGLSQANAQKGTNDQLAGSLSDLGKPFSAAGGAELGQVTGGASVGGPMGASITDQTTAAANLGGVAKQYSTGQLTDAQNLQVQDYIKQQRAMVDTQLAQSGNTDSSARQAAYQQIDDNAAKLTQQLTQGNVGIATEALQGVQSTYTTLLNQALASAQFGLGAQSEAVMLQIQSDTQLATSLNALFGEIARGFGTAMGGKPGGTSAGPAGATGNLLKQGGDLLKSLTGGSGAASGALPAITDTTGLGLPTSVPDVAGGVEAIPPVSAGDLGLSTLGTDVSSATGAGAGAGGAGAAGAGATAGGAAAAGGALTAADIGLGAGGLSDAAIAGDLASSTLLPSTEAALGGGGAAGAASAADSAATTAGLGSAAGAFAALGLFAIPVILALSTPTVALGKQYWSGLSKTLQSNAPPGNPDMTKPGWYNSTPELEAWWKSPAFATWQGGYDELLNMLARGDQTPYTQQQLDAFGLTPEIVDQYKAAKPPGPAGGSGTKNKVQPD